MACVKRVRLPVTGTLGFAKAEVTAGGVALDEIDSRTLQSRRAPGLFLAGNYLRGPAIGACIERAQAVAKQVAARLKP